ncbi:short chain oxidoreductase/dehydrogenase [Penicillium canescens]|uniref:Short chain oxidoreductase/dehydrogenase n=1 Tax=Penicillium canescens TaxID=5083 RepID=A0AAD6I2G2_PENCN|nr:short chain oxidoreductase/dehydrogenase [Penicillium canescens]KAJ6008845.1 short chain oxidoreductase/dehydrogenase [Penicillium canescens]KAJ6027650.1 short chain oxidoreductase/dehydrogenase [Penicillium canescens]KAJ6040928.1 short chain oxidoreductase/dehydrogenase [Penicillium canescens]KAJ6066716.1 short chain oxidoreductase/dehydrogenase [Penicillium canescens]
MASQLWLITGASSGFGALMAENALKAGHRVLATARNPMKAAQGYPQIESLGGKWLQLDVTSKQTKEQVGQAILENGGKIDVIINNAGYGLLGSIEDISEEELDTQFQTNVYGTVRVIKAALPFMRAQRSGTIVNFSSIAGFAAGPASAAYSMSKFAVEALSESLFAELNPFNIRVLLVEPGAFRTNFIGSHKLPAAGMTKDYEGTPLGAAMGFFDGFAGKQPGDPTKAVQRVLDVIQLQGMGQGKEKLLRLPLGTDCFPRMLDKIDNMKGELEQMREIALSTAVDSA